MGEDVGVDEKATGMDVSVCCLMRQAKIDCSRLRLNLQKISAEDILPLYHNFACDFFISHG